MRPWLFSVFALCLWTTVAHASPRPSGDPVSMVREATTRITTIASEATEQAALTADIETVMDGLVDFEGFSARTLKSQWKPLSASKRRRFVTAFRALVMRTYGKRFKPGATFRVTYRGDTTFGDGPTALVSTTIPTHMRGSAFSIVGLATGSCLFLGNVMAGQLMDVTMAHGLGQIGAFMWGLGATCLATFALIFLIFGEVFTPQSLPKDAQAKANVRAAPANTQTT